MNLILLAPMIVCVTVIATTGCSRDPCKTMWEKAQRCENLPDRGLAEMIETCRADANMHEVARRTLECSRRCDELDSCFRAALRQVEVETVAQRAEPFAREGDWDRVYWTCRGAREQATESSLAQVDRDCTLHLREGFDALTEKLGSARDGALPLEAVTDTDERAYERIAEQLGASEQAAAALRVAELYGKHSLEYTRAKVSKELGEEEPRLMGEVAWQCSRSLTLLGEIDSDWARGSAREVAKLCYLDLGQAVLEFDRVTALGCWGDVKYIIEGIDAYGLAGENPAVDAKLVTLRADCE